MDNSFSSDQPVDRPFSLDQPHDVRRAFDRLCLDYEVFDNLYNLPTPMEAALLLQTVSDMIISLRILQVLMYARRVQTEKQHKGRR